MNTLRETSYINTLPYKSKFSAYIQTAKFPNFDDGAVFSKVLCYACITCDGQLVPITCHAFCNMLFGCTKCNQTENIRIHKHCECMASVARVNFSKIQVVNL